jgi:hypothetical protein
VPAVTSSSASSADSKNYRLSTSAQKNYRLPTSAPYTQGAHFFLKVLSSEIDPAESRLIR